MDALTGTALAIEAISLGLAKKHGEKPAVNRVDKLLKNRGRGLGAFRGLAIDCSKNIRKRYAREIGISSAG